MVRSVSERRALRAVETVSQMKAVRMSLVDGRRDALALVTEASALAFEFVKFARENLK